MMHAKFNFGGLESFLLKRATELEQLDIDAAVVESLEIIGEQMLLDMQEGVARHQRTGKAYSALKMKPVVSAGNYHSVEVGAMDIRGADKDGFHIIYQEYGSPTFPADPWLRPAMEKLKKYKDKIIKQVMKIRGAPRAAA